MTTSTTLLVTGGTGYIGSHACVVLQQAGYDVVILDNLVNSRRDVIERIASITGRTPTFFEGDVRDTALLARILKEHEIGAVLHFAGLKAVGESVAQPVEYYDVNVGGALSLCRAMKQANVKRLIFSSSATVYGEPPSVPVREDFPTRPESPYGQSKLMVEHILRDLHHSDPTWSIASLRYFNPVGAHESGRIGELPNGIPNNLMPYIAQVAHGQLEYLSIYGNDYPTSDGTGIRDYIHVMDLAEGHLAALRRIESQPEHLVLNLGTGRPHTVMEMLHAFEEACGKPLAHRFVARRPGDIAEYWADPTAARNMLGWRASREVQVMCEDTWRWQHFSMSIPNTR